MSKFYNVKLTFYAKDVAKALSKLVRDKGSESGKGSENVKVELVDKSKCRTIILKLYDIFCMSFPLPYTLL